jgi:uncharacterized membrane protein
LYAAVFWFGLHVYLVQLLLHIAQPRFFDVYRRAAFIALGHPGYTLLILVGSLVVGSVSLVFLPAFVLIGPAYLAVLQAHAFREIRRRHGDLVAEVEEELPRLCACRKSGGC